MTPWMSASAWSAERNGGLTLVLVSKSESATA